jgi:DnaK suppressor protein
LADLALGTAQDAQASALLVHLHGLLEQVQAARARVVAGTYGTCTQCAQPIPLPRLQALPYAALCVNCQSGSERNRKSRRIRRV